MYSMALQVTSLQGTRYNESHDITNALTGTDLRPYKLLDIADPLRVITNDFAELNEWPLLPL
jgi:hypothetical protein